MIRRIVRPMIIALTAISLLPLGTVSAAAGPAPATPSAVAEMLNANPGSVRTGENTVLLKPGIMAILPLNGEVGVQAAGQCPRGWLCAWPDINFGGPMMAVQQGTYIAYIYWWYKGSQIVYSPSGTSPGSGWVSFYARITSVYNNTHSIAQAPFHPYFNIPGGNYYAPLGAPISYVGAYYNDSFDSACAC
jgi:Peptidase inhibitor family I36